MAYMDSARLALANDLKKKRASNESCWLIGQPDVRVEKITKGADTGKALTSELACRSQA
jgi:hypothetical protein